MTTTTTTTPETTGATTTTENTTTPETTTTPESTTMTAEHQTMTGRPGTTTTETITTVTTNRTSGVTLTRTATTTTAETTICETDAAKGTPGERTTKRPDQERDLKKETRIAARTGAKREKAAYLRNAEQAARNSGIGEWWDAANAIGKAAAEAEAEAWLAAGTEAGYYHRIARDQALGDDPENENAADYWGSREGAAMTALLAAKPRALRAAKEQASQDEKHWLLHTDDWQADVLGDTEDDAERTLQETREKREILGV